MKDYLNFLHELFEMLTVEMINFEQGLKTATSVDKDKLAKLNAILTYCKLLLPLLNRIDTSSLPKIHHLIDAILQHAAEAKIAKALTTLKQKPLFDFLLKYNGIVVELRNQILKYDEAINALKAFETCNTALQENTNAMVEITSEWISDSSNLLFASDEEYIDQQKKVALNRDNLKGLTEKENYLLNETLKKKNIIDLLFPITLDPSLLRKFFNENSDIIMPVKLEFINVISHANDYFSSYHASEIATTIQRQKEVIFDAESKYALFRNDILNLIDQLRSEKLAWELKNQRLFNELEEAFNNINALLNSINIIQLDIESHLNRMLTILGNNEGARSIISSKEPPQPNLSLEALEDLLSAYTKQLHVELARIQPLLSNHANAPNYLLSTVFATHLERQPTFNLNYPTNIKIRLADEAHQRQMDVWFEKLSTLNGTVTGTEESTLRIIRLTKLKESEILIKHKSSYAAINAQLFNEIKSVVLESDDFMALHCHQMSALNKAALINIYLESIKHSKNLEELISTLDENPKDESGLMLRQNTGLSKKFGVKLGGFIYGIFHHGYKSTCDEYASKLKILANNAINAKIESLGKPTL